MPKSIDNALSGTDYAFGFDTAVNIATECIDRLHTTAESHHRIMVVEVMGLYTGWLAVQAGIAGGADIILIPEIPVNLEEVYELLHERHKRGKPFSIIVISEGTKIEGYMEHSSDKSFPSWRSAVLASVGEFLAKAIEDNTSYETRVSVLGYILRGDLRRHLTVSLVRAWVLRRLSLSKSINSVKWQSLGKTRSVLWIWKKPYPSVNW